MRLICPQCNALYEVSSDMIPPEGREVECSACGNVWYQRANLREMRGLAQDLRAARPEKTRAKAPAPAADLGEGPALRRPLPDDVLSILREETAREMSARRGIRLEDPLPPRGGQTDSAEAVPEPAPIVEKAAAPEPEPAPEPILPVPPPVSRPAPVTPPVTSAAPAAVTPPPLTDWPATTVTAPDDSQPRVVSRRQPATPIPAKDLHPTPILAAAPQRPLVEDAIAPTVADATPNPAMPPLPRRRVVKTLPDAERLAATLQTQAPPTPDLPVAVPQPEPTPDRYRAGFSRALSVAAAVALAYVAGAAWVGTGAAPAPVARAVASIDAARAGLQDAAQSLLGNDGKSE